jgi:cytochrome P450 family 6
MKIWSHYHGLLSGSTIEVKEMMARFTINVIASCALGINSNSLKNQDSEFGRNIRKISEFTLQKRFVEVLAFFAPFLNNVFRVKFMDEKTNFFRQMVWNTVEQR